MDVDYGEVGLKVGLEIHQQLNSKRKLFCGCRPSLFNDEPDITFQRRLRPTQSELGQVDPAAFFEFKKGVQILYEADSDSSCLVEMDEEPPHDLTREALEATLVISLMLAAKPVDEIHVMRKTVIDGSNTTGFQRTCIVALNGRIKTGEKAVEIQHVGLEEDAARKISEDGNVFRYRIDRLCIPLVEVATAPVISTPDEAREVALAVGQILRATGRVMRGIGTIRQDLNISIREGALIEIKGVQELELVSLAVEYEVQRQLNLLEIRKELKRREAKEEALNDDFVDITHVFSSTRCKVIRKALDEGKRVLAAKLPKFEGVLKRELTPGIRLGTEMADRARFWGRVGGLFHTDELPAYGITVEEINLLRKALDAKPSDSVVFVADAVSNANDALDAVIERAKEAIRGVPQETRAARLDGSTRYMRPRPGAARMYPETDVPPIQLSREYLERLGSYLPEMPEQRMQRFIQKYGLNKKLARQILDSEFSQLFEESVKGSQISPTVVAVVLTETLKALRRNGVATGNISDKQFLELFRLVGVGEAAKEAVSDIMVWLSKHKGAQVSEALDDLNLRLLSRSRLEAIVDDLIRENKEMLIARREKAFALLMGLIMKDVRGRAKAEHVSEIVRIKLQELK